MTEALEKLRPLADAFPAAKKLEADERAALGARSGNTSSNVGTHPRLQPTIRACREAYSAFCDTDLDALVDGDLGSEAMAVWDDFLELDQPEPHADVLQGSWSEKMRREHARWGAHVGLSRRLSCGRWATRAISRSSPRRRR
jgi:hypothetical protein